MELVAVSLAIIYLLLAVKQNILCWPAAIMSSSIYFFIMYSAGLYMEAYLQIFYVLMGLYGWSQWKSNEASLIVRTWTKRNHLFAFSSIILLTFFHNELPSPLNYYIFNNYFFNIFLSPPFWKTN